MRNLYQIRDKGLKHANRINTLSKELADEKTAAAETATLCEQYQQEAQTCLLQLGKTRPGAEAPTTTAPKRDRGDQNPGAVSTSMPEANGAASQGAAKKTKLASDTKEEQDVWADIMAACKDMGDVPPVSGTLSKPHVLLQRMLDKYYTYQGGAPRTAPGYNPYGPSSAPPGVDVNIPGATYAPGGPYDVPTMPTLTPYTAAGITAPAPPFQWGSTGCPPAAVLPQLFNGQLLPPGVALFSLDGNGPAGSWPPAGGLLNPGGGQFNPEDHATTTDYENYDFLQADLGENMEDVHQEGRTEQEAAPEMEAFDAQTAEYQRQLAALGAQQQDHAAQAQATC